MPSAEGTLRRARLPSMHYPDDPSRGTDLTTPIEKKAF